MPYRYRVLVADDSKYFNSSIWQMLIPETDFNIVGLASNPDEAISMSATLNPDIILADLSLFGMPGLQPLATLRTLHPNIPIIAFSPIASKEYTQAALNAGATICLTKSEIVEVLPQTLCALIPLLTGSNHLTPAAGDESCIPTGDAEA